MYTSYINLRYYVVMKAMYSPGYYDSGFVVATHALGHMKYSFFILFKSFGIWLFVVLLYFVSFFCYNH